MGKFKFHISIKFKYGLFMYQLPKFTNNNDNNNEISDGDLPSTQNNFYMI